MTLAIREPLGLYAQLACVWEATAQKPGNVHRFADFDDVSYLDFLASAAAISPVFDKLSEYPRKSQGAVGQTIPDAITQTRRVVQTNTNLGIVLLLTPLAWARCAESIETFAANVQRVLNELDVADAKGAYEAIRLAQPGGLGQVAEQDIGTEPTLTLREVMALAADRDLIARQYANGFREVFEVGIPALQHGLTELGCLEDAIIYCHLSLLGKHPDSLIARKCGNELAENASRRAAHVIEAGWPKDKTGREAIAKFDSWLRADGHRRNPGTTADLVAACLFVALRLGIISLPLTIPWARQENRS